MNWLRFIYLRIVGDVCPTCKRRYHDTGNIMMIECCSGECGRCDHVRGEVADDMRYEVEQMQEAQGK